MIAVHLMLTLAELNKRVPKNAHIEIDPNLNKVTCLYYAFKSVSIWLSNACVECK